MKASTIKSLKPLGFQWDTTNPFIFCAHHNDAYPAGNEKMGPNAPLTGRNIGSDFVPREGWRMYHGEVVPGFPVHPHRGFETITIVLEGWVDHADSMGASGRYGAGDVQWMTAGKGIQHTEMFPLLNRTENNPLELFQVWLNLPAADKFVEPYYTMLWNENIPIVIQKDKEDRNTEIRLIAGTLDNKKALSPPPNSWASKAENDISIFLIRMDPNAEWEIPGAMQDSERTIYFYRGSSLLIDHTEIPAYQAIHLEREYPVKIKNGNDEGFLLLLQGRPINEPIVQYGPFVMNTQEEIRTTFEDYRKTKFGGWPWPQPDQIHDREAGRFEKHQS